jgi:hypothetical protein
MKNPIAPKNIIKAPLSSPFPGVTVTCWAWLKHHSNRPRLLDGRKKVAKKR